MRRGRFNHGIHGTHGKLGLSQGLSPTASHNVVRLSTKSGEMASLEQMGRHPFGVALFIAHFDVFFYFPHFNGVGHIIAKLPRRKTASVIN